MALIKCPECGKEISDKASACIHCGYPISNIIENETKDNIQDEIIFKNNKSNKILYISLVVAAIIIFILTICLIPKDEKKQEEDHNEEYSTEIKSDKLIIDLYYGDTCSYCKQFVDYYDSLNENIKSQIILNKYEVWNNEQNETKAKKIAKKLKVDFRGVPFIVFNEKEYLDGFGEAQKEEFMNIIKKYINVNYTENTGPVTPTAKPTTKPTAKPTTKPTTKATVKPTNKPTITPTAKPNVAPTTKPTTAPTTVPTIVPTANPTATPTPKPNNYRITSITGIGNSYNYGSSSTLYNTCTLNSFNATLSKQSYSEKLTLNYSYSMTKTYENPNRSPLGCHVKYYVYDSNNNVVKSSSFSVDIGLNETGKKSGLTSFDISGTDYHIVIKENR